MKKIIALFFALTLTLSLCACGQKTPGTSTTGGEKTTITVWTTYTEDQLAYLKNSAEEYNKAHENAQVVVEEQPYQDFQAKVMQAVRAGNGPNIIIDYSSTAANYLTDGLVIDFKDYVSKDYPSTVDEGAYKEATSFTDGGQHILPLFTSGPIFFYNTDIYEELGLKAPETWEELTENSRKIKEAYPDKYGFAADSLTDLGQTLFEQAGNEIIDAEKRVVTFNTPEVAETVNWFADGVKEGLFMLNPTDNYFSGDFNSSTLVSYIGSVAGEPYLTLENYGMAPLPQGGKVEWTPSWNRGVIVFKVDEKKDAVAADFGLYLASPEVNAGFCKAANYVSPYAATRETETYKEHINGNKALSCLRPETAGGYPSISGTQTVRASIQEVLTQVATNVYDAETALANAEKTCNTEFENQYNK